MNTPTTDVQLQVADTVAGEVPPLNRVRKWTDAALEKIKHAGGEVTVRVVGEAEMAELNARYRGARGATNVLSFPCDELLATDVCVLGDVVICAPRVADEAAATATPVMDYWARLVIHGVLHLCGYDHEHRADAARMESLERGIMDDLGIAWCRAF